MHKFTRRFLTEWRRLDLSFSDGKILAAISGGADSCALAAVLQDLVTREKIKQPIIVAHFNHNLRGAAAGADEDFVRKLAERFEFRIIVEKWNAPATKNIEAAARQARYDFLLSAARKEKADLILTAHTVNDQAETFLLNLLRGSGTEGLSAMKSKRFLNSEGENFAGSFDESVKKVLLIRPLLSWARREDTEDFCHFSEVEFRRDRMNEDSHYRRVRIRKEVLPFLKQFNPQIIETLARTAALLEADAEISRQTAIEKLDQEAEFLRVDFLKTLPPNLPARVLREWLRKRRGNLRGLESKHLEAIEKLIVSRKSGKFVELPNKEIVWKSGGKLIFRAANKNKG